MKTANQILQTWLEQFTGQLAQGDYPAAGTLFEEGCYWRDLVAFSWNIITAEGRADVVTMLAATVPAAQPSGWVLDREASEQDGVVEGWFRFETAVSRGRGHLRLRDGQCWTLFTTMTELKGFEEKSGRRREQGTQHGAHRNRQSWLERKTAEEAALGSTKQPYCLIVGGGQGGIALGARLKRLEVPTLIVDQHERPGDAWRKRYKSLCLHDPVWYDHMPYIPFPDHWPVYSPKDKIGDWLEMYTKVMELNYWTSTRCQQASYDETTETWTVVVERAGEQITLHPKQLVLATGMSGKPSIPAIPGMDQFSGTLCHSSRYSSGQEYRGQRCVVVGSGNSAHDICADLWEHGADVTMIQRSSTLVVRAETLAMFGHRGLYSERAVEAGIDAETADRVNASWPYALQPARAVPAYQKMAELDAELYAGLEKAGFLLDFGEDGSGLAVKYHRRGSGYYIDVGASQLIVDGEIKLKSGVEIERITETGLLMADGTELTADLIIFATGYGSMNGWAAQLISQEVADKVGKCWGLGSNTKYDPAPWLGELRNMWKPTQQHGLWFHGGNLAQSRFYSLSLGLQIKARLEGVVEETAVYHRAKTHHLA
ncbi:MAG: NAD(P)/FAD-dependent oxidoreductase [Chloroflexota bacterium]